MVCLLDAIQRSRWLGIGQTINQIYTSALRLFFYTHNDQFMADMAEGAHTTTEDKVGIQTFVDPSIPGFSAIIKQR